jgi:uncharacterized protein YndB with AHSA1/START domain
MSTDRIEKKIVLRATLARVWQAIADAEKFGAWFGVKLAGEFAPGATVTGTITTKGYEHVPFALTVERVEPQRLLSYRWHPYAIDPAVDYTSEPTTLVELRLEEVAGGTQLTVVESGFDAIPAARRADALRMNDHGWAEQMKNLERYVAG